MLNLLKKAEQRRRIRKSLGRPYLSACVHIARENEGHDYYFSYDSNSSSERRQTEYSTDIFYQRTEQHLGRIIDRLTKEGRLSLEEARSEIDAFLKECKTAQVSIRSVTGASVYYPEGNFTAAPACWTDYIMPYVPLHDYGLGYFASEFGGLSHDRVHAMEDMATLKTDAGIRTLIQIADGKVKHRAAYRNVVTPEVYLFHQINAIRLLSQTGHPAANEYVTRLFQYEYDPDSGVRFVNLRGRLADEIQKGIQESHLATNPQGLQVNDLLPDSETGIVLKEAYRNVSGQ